MTRRLCNACRLNEAEVAVLQSKLEYEPNMRLEDSSDLGLVTRLTYYSGLNNEARSARTAASILLDHLFIGLGQANLHSPLAVFQFLRVSMHAHFHRYVYVSVVSFTQVSLGSTLNGCTLICLPTGAGVCINVCACVCACVRMCVLSMCCAQTHVKAVILQHLSNPSLLLSLPAWKRPGSRLSSLPLVTQLFCSETALGNEVQRQ